MTGPTDPCERTSCAAEPAHPGGAHLDPTHPLYDGPDISLSALPAAVRLPAFALLHAARHDSWQLITVHRALHAFAREIHGLRDQIAAVRVDRDRGIRDALARAEDCTEHGEGLRHERHQAYWFSRLADRLDAERIIWLTAVDQTDEALAGRTDEPATAIRAHIARVRRQARTARAATAPTLADCRRAGRCEHPATAPHAACRQLAAAAETLNPEAGVPDLQQRPKAEHAARDGVAPMAQDARVSGAREAEPGRAASAASNELPETGAPAAQAPPIAASLRVLVGLRCPDCGRHLLLDEPNGWVVCANGWCSAMGLEVPLWRAAHRQHHGGDDPNPAGWPRPVHRGLPIPWVTVIAVGQPWFRHLHGERLLRCQTAWLCQMCGLELPPRAWVVTAADRHVVTPAALHRRCLDLAAAACPYLRERAGHRDAEVTQEMILADGRPLLQTGHPLQRQVWTLAPSATA